MKSEVVCMHRKIVPKPKAKITTRGEPDPWFKFVGPSKTFSVQKHRKPKRTTYQLDLPVYRVKREKMTRKEF